MNVTRPRNSAIFRSWESSDNTTLIVLITDDGVSLQHIDARSMAVETNVLQLSVAEAVEVAERILRVLRGGHPNNPIDQPGAQLIVTRNTAGDPYREGVAITLSSGNWEKDFRFCMEDSFARDLATLMHSAQD